MMRSVKDDDRPPASTHTATASATRSISLRPSDENYRKLPGKEGWTDRSRAGGRGEVEGTTVSKARRPITERLQQLNAERWLPVIAAASN